MPPHFPRSWIQHHPLLSLSYQPVLPETRTSTQGPLPLTQNVTPVWWLLALCWAECCPGPVGSSTTCPCRAGVCVACHHVCTAHSVAVCLHRATGAKPSAGAGVGGGHAAGTAHAGCCFPLVAPCWPCHLPMLDRALQLCPHPSPQHTLQHPLQPMWCCSHAGMATALTCSRPLP